MLVARDDFDDGEDADVDSDGASSRRTRVAKLLRRRRAQKCISRPAHEPLVTSAHLGPSRHPCWDGSFPVLDPRKRRSVRLDDAEDDEKVKRRKVAGKNSVALFG